MNEKNYIGFDTDDYLDAAKKHFKVDSDRQLALRIGVTPGAISQYRSGARAMDDYCASQIANFLKINPMLVIAAANERREKQEPRKEYWRNIQSCLTTGGNLMYAVMLSVLVYSQVADFSGENMQSIIAHSIYYAHI